MKKKKRNNNKNKNKKKIKKKKVKKKEKTTRKNAIKSIFHFKQFNSYHAILNS